MRLFFDEDVPINLVRCLPQHEIQTVAGMRWGGVKNGELLTLIEREGFEVFLTGDKNMESQERVKGRPFAVLIMSAINWPVIKSHLPKITAAIDAAVPGAVRRIDCGEFVARKNPNK